MTMVTASTALTIFIMNIHFCGAEAKPVPHWAKVLIIDYMSKIFFVYEVGENCASGSSSSSSGCLQEDSGRQKVNSHIHANGKPRGQEGHQNHKHLQSQSSRQQHRVKVHHHIIREESSHLNSFAPGKFEVSNGRIPTSDYSAEDQKVHPEDQNPLCCSEDIKPPPQGPTVTFGPCIFCSYASGMPNVDTKLVRNVEYIANCFREQRATCAKVAEWKKIAKVMDRFFMWIFFIMVFLMSILVIGKAK